MHNLPKKLKCLVIALLSAGFFAGCTPPARKPEPLPPNPPPDRPPTYALPGTPARRPAPAPEDSDRLNMALIRRVNSLPGVKSSSVAVVGTTAYVGVEKTANLSNTLVRDLTQDIPLVVKTYEPRIVTVMLSYRPDIKQRISKVSDDIARGRPASVYASDLREIIAQSEPVR